MFRLHFIGNGCVECVVATEVKRSRVKALHFADDQTAKDWMAENRERDTLIREEDALRIRHLDVNLPDPAVRVSWYRRSIIVGPSHRRAYGITDAISSRLRDTDPFSWRRNKSCKLSKTKMLRLGMKVDREMKKFALGQTTYNGLKEEESRAIINFMAGRDISLVTSGLLVSNYEKGATRSGTTLSGTEIDLIGFDHRKRSLVVIELKITSSTLTGLKDKNKLAPLDKLSGFRQSTLGRYAAQVACSALMYRCTYNSPLNYALLIMCEAGTCHCEAFHISENLIDSTRFRGWIPGF